MSRHSPFVYICSVKATHRCSKKIGYHCFAPRFLLYAAPFGRVVSLGGRCVIEEKEDIVMQRYYKSVKYTVIGGYVVLTALLLVSLWLVLNKMTQLSALDYAEMELYEKRLRTNEAFTALYKVETMGQTIDLTKTADYMAYTEAVDEALAAVDSLKNIGSDSALVLRADSIHILLLEKVGNMRRFIRTTTLESARKDAQLVAMLAHQDTLLAVRSEQYRLMARSDSMMAAEQKKGFWSKLARVFSGGRYRQEYDSLQQANAELSVYGDSLASRLRNIETGYAEKRDSVQNVLAWHRMQLERDNRLLSMQINRLMHEYEQELATLIVHRSMNNEQVRRETLNTIFWVAFVAIFIAFVFGGGIWLILNRNNRYKTELEDANRRTAALLDAREKMMLAITHDFKAPLGSIIGYISLLRRLVQGERQQLYLDNMRESSEHLLGLVNNLLDFYRLDSDKMSVTQVAFNPYALFEKEAVTFRPIAEAKGVKLHAVGAADNGMLCVGDPIKLRQIVDNLLSNAVKFTDSGAVVLRYTINDSEIAFSVSDTGCGMEEKDMERIFGEFTRLSEAQGKEGFGLGLSITRKLVLLLGGNIEVSSEPGNGSTFSVRVPVEPFTDESEQQSAMPFVGLRVLLLDDDNLQLAMFEGQLEALGVQVVSCSHIEDALSYLRHEPCDVFFTDIQMPEADGFELMRRLHAETDERMRKVPVVAVSARSDMDKAMLSRHGFAAMLAKPFSQQELCEVIASVTGHDVPVSALPDTMADASPQEAEKSGYHFDTLTAFAAGDDVACRNILATCRDELQGQVAEMKAALAAGNAECLARVAHKWVPLFTMVGAQQHLPLLRKIEHPVDGDFPQSAVETVIHEAEAIITALQEFLQEEKE